MEYTRMGRLYNFGYRQGKQGGFISVRAKKGTSRQTCPHFFADVDIASGQGVTCNNDLL